MAKTSTKRAMLGSAISLLLCFAMLVGTTFAWFTDNVASTNNIIKSGNLDVELYYMNSETTDWTKVDGSTNVFKKDTLWEPGHAEVVKLKVVNEGSLALKYQLGVNVASEKDSVNVNGDKFKLSDYIKYGIVEGAQSYTRETAIAAVDATANALNVKYVSDTTELLAKTATDTENPNKIVTMVVYMPTSVGNEANHKPGAVVPEINLGINLIATQKDYEEDSFGKDYDEEATYPAVNSINVLETCTEKFDIKVEEVTVTVPAGSEAGVYKLEVSNKTVETIGSETTASFDISLYKDDEKITGKTIPVKIQIGKFLNVTGLKHNGDAVTNFGYDAATGILSFETDSFSVFDVTYTEIGENVKIDGDKISAGVFHGVNPATIDPSLGATDSEYIAINYEKDGETSYVVSKRSETVIVGASDTVYTAENDNYDVTTASGKLYTIFQKNYSKVFILPGTYEEGTAVTITKSVDVMGLGDAEDIKIVKLSGSKSNRHVFNCNGAVTNENHINVTISNLHITVNAKNGDGTIKMLDNGAVQAIRLSKVKCYDLIIEKGSGYPFYVQGKYDTRGTYMYVENCSTKTSSVVDTDGTYKFYHSNLTYSTGTYTTNSGSIKNLSMDADDWDWD